MQTTKTRFFRARRVKPRDQVLPRPVWIYRKQLMQPSREHHAAELPGGIVANHIEVGPNRRRQTCTCYRLVFPQSDQGDFRQLAPCIVQCFGQRIVETDPLGPAHADSAPDLSPECRQLPFSIDSIFLGQILYETRSRRTNFSEQFVGCSDKKPSNIPPHSALEPRPFARPVKRP